MEKLIAILESIRPGVDYENHTRLVDDGVLDSLTIARLIGEIEDEFDVMFEVTDLIPENFNSVSAIMKTIENLEE